VLPYDPSAPAPVTWHNFLDELWAHDHQAEEALQEIFGYLLTPDTSQQKAFVIAGPPRSGKGTLARVLTQLVGPRNTTSPGLAQFSKEFGLQPLIAKLLAIISDARWQSARGAAVEYLLSITGEDHVSVNRKNKAFWEGRLPTRFLFLANSLPDLKDDAGAVAKRFITLQLTTSFYGREDTHLTERLEAELPGILLWALEGWRRLQQRGHFNEPQSSVLAKEKVAQLGSPVRSFVADCCELAPGATIAKAELYEAYQNWSLKNGHAHPLASNKFGEALFSAHGDQITEVRPTVSGARKRAYMGVQLKGRRGGHGDGQIPF
jgi:putative DNA primase/helicase